MKTINADEMLSDLYEHRPGCFAVGRESLRDLVQLKDGAGCHVFEPDLAGHIWQEIPAGSSIGRVFGHPAVMTEGNGYRWEPLHKP